MKFNSWFHRIVSIAVKLWTDKKVIPRRRGKNLGLTDSFAFDDNLAQVVMTLHR